MEFIKKNIKYIGIVMICVFCSYLVTLATNYAFESSDVRFDNTGTSLESVNVQDALDETFHHVTDYNEIKTTIGTGSLTTTSQNIIGAVNELNGRFVSVGSATNPVTDLASIPLNSIGNCVLAASISPSGVLRSHSYVKTGSSVNRYTIIATDQYDNKTYYNVNYDGTFKGWKQLTTNDNVAADSGALPNGTDLNTVVESATYILSSSNTYTHMPSGASVLIVSKPNKAGTNILQIAIGVRKYYVRIRSDATTWQEWRSIDNYGKGWLPNATDLDDVIYPGSYGLSSSQSYSNGPISPVGGILEVIAPASSAETYVIQRVTNNNVVFIRYRSGTNGTTWSEWKKTTLESIS